MNRIVERFSFRGVEYQLRLTFCNKPKCKSCPHGPYWYGLISLGGARQTLRYVGKTLKGPVAEEYARTAKGPDWGTA